MNKEHVASARVLKAKKGRRSARLIIGVSVACNLHCKFCVFGDFRNEFKELTTKKVISVLSRYANVCNRVAFTGGEPTLREDLPEIICAAKSLGYKVILQSNGRLYAYKEFCRRLIRCGVEVFCVSLSAHSSRLYDSLALTKGNFAQVIAGIANLVSLHQKVRINTVVSTYNVDSLEKIAKLMVRLGVYEQCFSLIREIPDSKGEFRKGYFTRRSSGKAVKRIFKAIDILSNSGIIGRIHMIPPCHLPGYESCYSKYLGTTRTIVIPPRTKDGKQVHINIGEQVVFRKARGCKRCIYDRTCEGIAEFAPFEHSPVMKAKA